MAHVLPEGVSAGEMKDSERASAAVLAPPSPLGRVGVGVGGAAEKEHAEAERLVFRRSHLHLGREEAFFRSCRLLAHERDEHAGVAEGGAAGGEVARGMAGGGAGATETVALSGAAAVARKGVAGGLRIGRRWRRGGGWRRQ